MKAAAIVDDIIGPAPSGNVRRQKNESPPPDDDRLRPIVVRLADVKSRPVDWLWQYHFARSSVSLVTGPVGPGKTLITCDMAARVTTGRGWPNDRETRRPPASVVMVVVEDDIAMTFRPRLEAVEADVERIHSITMMTDGDGRDYLFNLERDAPVLREVIQTVGEVAMVIIDPLGSFMSRTDTHRHSEVYTALAPVASLAQALGVAIIGVHHHNKANDPSAVNRVMGSAAYGAIARNIWSVLPDPESNDPRVRLFAHAKASLCEAQDTLRFETHGVFAPGCTEPVSAIHWHDEPVKMTADEVLARDAEKRSKGRGPSATDRAVSFVQEQLAGGPLASKELDVAADAAGISGAALRRAKHQLGVKSFPDRGDGAKVRAWNVAMPGSEA